MRNTLMFPRPFPPRAGGLRRGVAGAAAEDRRANAPDVPRLFARRRAAHRPESDAVVAAPPEPPARRAARGRVALPERGSMSVFVVIFSVVVFLLAGLLVDGGSAINARLRAADIAEQGARAAADEIDVDRLRTTGRIALLPDRETVCRRAQEIIDAQELDGVRLARCEVGGDEVTVAVGVRWEAFFLSALGFGGDEMEAGATAGPDAGDGAT